MKTMTANVGNEEDSQGVAWVGRHRTQLDGSVIESGRSGAGGHGCSIEIFDVEIGCGPQAVHNVEADEWWQKRFELRFLEDNG